MLVESRLCRGESVGSREAVEIAHGIDLPVAIDAAAQDLQLEKMLEFGADLTLFSAQKYLSSPTAGLVIGQRDWVDAVHAQERGIGRGMKAGKEAVIGAIAALQHRRTENRYEWIAGQTAKAEDFAQQLNALPGVHAELVDDPVGNPFARVRAWIDREICGSTASAVAKLLAEGDPLISVQDHDDANRALMFEILALTADELIEIHRRLADILEHESPDVR